jgi:hypothetical protein
LRDKNWLSWLIGRFERLIDGKEIEKVFFGMISVIFKGWSDVVLVLGWW